LFGLQGTQQAQRLWAAGEPRPFKACRLSMPSISGNRSSTGSSNINWRWRTARPSTITQIPSDRDWRNLDERLARSGLFFLNKDKKTLVLPGIQKFFSWKKKKKN